MRLPSEPGLNRRQGITLDIRMKTKPSWGGLAPTYLFAGSDWHAAKLPGITRFLWKPWVCISSHGQARGCGTSSPERPCAYQAVGKSGDILWGHKSFDF